MNEILGRGGHVAQQATNCAAPDTGNMGTTKEIFSVMYMSSLAYNRGARTLWLAGAAEGMVAPSFERRNSLRICYD